MYGPVSQQTIPSQHVLIPNNMFSLRRKTFITNSLTENATSVFQNKMRRTEFSQQIEDYKKTRVCHASAVYLAITI